MGFLDWFHKKSVNEYLDELEGLLLVIAKYPDKPADEEKLMEEAKFIASRCFKIISKIDHLDRVTADAISRKLYLIAQPLGYKAMREQAQIAMQHLMTFKKSVAKKAEIKEAAKQLEFKRGEMRTYLRIMSKKELGCVNETQALDCGKPNADVQAIVATGSQRTYLKEFVRSKALRDIYSLMGGKETPDFVVVFKTDVVPKETGASRYPKFINVKFPAKTPIKIIDTHRV